MDQNTRKRSEVSLRDIILTVRSWFAYLLSFWMFIIGFGLLGGILGYLYSSYQKKIYKSNLTFVVEESNSGSGMGQYSGLASMVGIDLNGSGGGIFQGDNLLELYRSRTMIEKTLLSTVKVGGSDELIIDRYITMNNLRETWMNQPSLKKLKFKANTGESLNRLQDSIMNSFVKDINNNILTVTKPDKKLSIINVEVNAKDELFALNFTNQIVANVNEFYVQTKTKKSSDNLNILQHQTDSIRQRLNYAIGSVALSADMNPNPNAARQILRVPSQRRQVDAEANKAILMELVKNLEISKINLRKEMPLIQVIDAPRMPLESQKVGMITASTLGFLILSVICSIFLLCRLMFKNIMSPIDNG